MLNKSNPNRLLIASIFVRQSFCILINGEIVTVFPSLVYVVSSPSLLSSSVAQSYFDFSLQNASISVLNNGLYWPDAASVDTMPYHSWCADSVSVDGGIATVDTFLDGAVFDIRDGRAVPCCFLTLSGSLRILFCFLLPTAIILRHCFEVAL